MIQPLFNYAQIKEMIPTFENKAQQLVNNWETLLRVFERDMGFISQHFSKLIIDSLINFWMLRQYVELERIKKCFHSPEMDYDWKQTIGQINQLTSQLIQTEVVSCLQFELEITHTHTHTNGRTHTYAGRERDQLLFPRF